MRMPIFVLLSALFAASALAHQWYIFEDFDSNQSLQKWKQAKSTHF